MVAMKVSGSGVGHAGGRRQGRVRLREAGGGGVNSGRFFETLLCIPGETQRCKFRCSISRMFMKHAAHCKMSTLPMCLF